jgi:hypothetical protein
VRSLLRSYMNYWNTSYGRETRRQHVLFMTPVFPVLVGIGIWAHLWAVVVIGVAMTLFCIWRLRALAKQR